MSEVVSLYGTWKPPTDTSNAALVQELERLLTEARAGELVGVAGCQLYKDRTVKYSYTGTIAKYNVLGALSCLTERLKHIIMQRD